MKVLVQQGKIQTLVVSMMSTPGQDPNIGSINDEYEDANVNDHELAHAKETANKYF